MVGGALLQGDHGLLKRPGCQTHVRVAFFDYFGALARLLPQTP